jgi:hypothetical protein
MALTMDDKAWQEGFDATNGARCPYAIGTTEAWSWRAGRIEGKAKDRLTAKPIFDRDLSDFFKQPDVQQRSRERRAWIEGFKAGRDAECPYPHGTLLNVNWWAGNTEGLLRMETPEQLPRSRGGIIIHEETSPEDAA